jgi:Holliday junction resolvase RusA-like endonuclease
LQFPKPKKPSNPFPKEDIDNCAKAILDALNEIAYLDDKQIVELHIKKEYTQFSGRIQIQISPQEHQLP